MKKIFCSLCLLSCLYLLKAGLPARPPKSHTSSASINKDGQVWKNSTGKSAYQPAFECTYTTLYVDSSRSASGDGGSWETAFKGLNEAMNAAVQCPGVKSILVAKGTYKPHPTPTATVPLPS